MTMVLCLRAVEAQTRPAPTPPGTATPAAGDALPRAADYVVVRAADGYRTTFALAELDAAVTDKVVIIADRRNGEPLAADIGPFRIVVPDETSRALDS